MSASSPTPELPKLRGALKIFLGYAAGTGKTYHMLQDGQKLKASGVDVVIGYFEPHARKDTIAQTEGLETVPRRKVEYRGAMFEEMDTDAVLKRKPVVCLVDEFAHTNVPGSPREKRWEDVWVLQGAGIDVWTTMNVQHIESLNDQIWHVTGIRVRETVPDWVVKEAAQVVMVDTTPRALRHRLERGVVYGPEKARKALENFFTESNLTALRELALRQTAQQVEDRREDPSESRTELAKAGHDRVLIYLNPDPMAVMLIRRGKRVADYLHADCLAVYVQKDEHGTNVSKEDQYILDKLLSFARNLHIQVTTLTSAHTAKALGEFAREHHVTQLFVNRDSPEIASIIKHARNMEVTIVAQRRR